MEPVQSPINIDQTPGPIQVGVEHLEALPKALPRLAYSLGEVAEMLNLSQKTIRRLIQRELLKPMGATRHIRIARHELERFVKVSQ